MISLMGNSKKITIKSIIVSIGKQNGRIIIGLGMLSILIGIIPLMQIQALSSFIDISIQQINNPASVQKVIWYLLLILSSYFFMWSADVVKNYLNKKLGANIRKKNKTLLLSKCQYFHLEDLEKGAFHDLNLRIINNFETICEMVFADFVRIISMLIRVLGIVFIVIDYAWWIAIVIVASVIPLIFYSFHAGRQNYQVAKKLTRQEREIHYYSEIMTSRETALERTLFGFTDNIDKKFKELYQNWYQKKLRVDLQNLVKMNLGTMISTFSGIVTFLFLLSSVINNVLTIGLFISLVYAVFDLSDILSGNLTTLANDSAKIQEYINDLNEYLTYEREEIKGYEPIEVVFHTLEFRNVSFKYPNSQKYILRDFSCVLEAKKHYALVGLNGAGKTTFVKLALGLYHHFEGEILLNGIDIRSYSRVAINHIGSAIFQDFSKYEMTLNENIFMNTPKKYDDSRAVLEQLQLPKIIGKLPSGLETHLGKLKEDGIDLSGGEWQKIALARMMVRDTPLLFLDEPTAAMDPIMESQVYNEFLNVTRGKTSVVISHRLGATRFYDNILVIDNGHIIESGNHDQLMNMKGLYCQMYENQRSWYQ